MTGWPSESVFSGGLDEASCPVALDDDWDTSDEGEDAEWDGGAPEAAGEGNVDEAEVVADEPGGLDGEAVDDGRRDIDGEEEGRAEEDAADVDVIISGGDVGGVVG